MRKRAFFLQGQERQGFPRLVLEYAAQGNPPPDAEIAKKAPFPDENQPAYLTRFCGEGGEVLCPVGFSIRGARSRTRQYVEHPEARKHRWVRRIAGRSRKLVRYAGLSLRHILWAG
jgi:hypothetical protein